MFLAVVLLKSSYDARRAVQRYSRPPPMQGTGRQLDERLAKALSHPLRQRILQRLNEGGVRSPNELSRELGDPLGNVSYHVRILRELDCVELVRTEQRRGALEHYYRATAEPWLDDEQWARLPAAFRRKTLGRTLSEILEGASAASRETGFDHPEVKVDRLELELDDAAWSEVVKLLNDTHEAALRIQSESARRQELGTNGGEPIRTELGILHFRRGDAADKLAS
jgi:DNA-binding transcriptional ArsR family regulator